MRLEIAAAAVASVLAPTAAFAVDYLSADQAQRQLFPAADRFESRELALSAEQLRQLESAGVRGRSVRWPLRVALRGSEVLGVVVVDEVIGKFELITYAVGIGRDGRLLPVEVLSYRESHGHEIRLPAWRRQFAGKTAASPLRVGDDIQNISGATLSCSHVTEGVRRIAAVVDLATRQGLL